MPPVPLQVGVSLGFKGTGGGEHSKSRKRKNTNKTAGKHLTVGYKQRE